MAVESLTGERDLTQFDPFAPEVQADLGGWFAALRRQEPVHYNEASGYWFVTSRAAIDEALRQPQLFSSEMEHRFKLPPPPEVTDEVAAIRACGYERIKALVYTDPPAHDRQRALVGKAFTPRLVRALEPEVVTIVDELLDGLPEDEPFDFVERYAFPLPALVVARLLNVTPARLSDFKRWAEGRLGTAANRPSAEEYVRMASDEVELQQYLAAELDRRRADPRDDLLTALVTARLSAHDAVEGAPLTTEECLSILGLLISAGVETTTNLLAETMRHTAEHPELWDWVRDDPGPRSEQLVEESLRYFSPAKAIPRVTKADTALDGVPIPKDSLVFLVYASANRDERTYPDPDAFACGRVNARQHLAFGHGRHFCLGAGIARLEATVTWQRMTARYIAPTLSECNRFPMRPGFALPALTELFVELIPRG